jgi:hypothetical protein
MKKIISLLFLVIVSLSCSTDVDSNGSFGSSKIVGFLKPIQNVTYPEDEGVVQKQFPFDLLSNGNGNSSTFNEDITITFTIDNLLSTATAGLEYDWVNDSNQVVIPAGQTYGSLPLNINTGNFNDSENTSLVLTMTSVDKEGFVISSQSKKLIINFVKCLSSIEGVYNVVVTREDGIEQTFYNETIEYVSPNYYKTTTTGHWPLNSISSNQGFFLSEICGAIQVESQSLAQGSYTNIVRGLSSDGHDGEVIDENTFKVIYEITFATGNITYTSVYTRI